MRYGWRRRSEIGRPRYWTALIFPLIGVAVILLLLGWEVTHADMDGDYGGKLSASPQPDSELASTSGIGDVDAIPETQPDAGRFETASLRQQLTETDLKLNQGDAALISTKQRVQQLEVQLAATKDRIADAESRRDEALRTAGKMWEDWRHLRVELTAVCAAVNTAKKPAPANPDAAAVAAACRDANQQK